MSSNRIHGAVKVVDGMTLRGDNLRVKGSRNRIFGYGCIIEGDENTYEGNGGYVHGDLNKVNGNGNSVEGSTNTIKGKGNKIKGKGNIFNKNTNTLITDDTDVFPFKRKEEVTEDDEVFRPKKKKVKRPDPVPVAEEPRAVQAPPQAIAINLFHDIAGPALGDHAFHDLLDHLL